MYMDGYGAKRRMAMTTELAGMRHDTNVHMNLNLNLNLVINPVIATSAHPIRRK
jgi:hypothetical protein